MERNRNWPNYQSHSKEHGNEEISRIFILHNGNGDQEDNKEKEFIFSVNTNDHINFENKLDTEENNHHSLFVINEPKDR